MPIRVLSVLCSLALASIVSGAATIPAPPANPVAYQVKAAGRIHHTHAAKVAKLAVKPVLGKDASMSGSKY